MLKQIPTKKALLGLALLLIGGAIGAVVTYAALRPHPGSPTSQGFAIRQAGAQYQFVKPLLGIDFAENKDFLEYKTLSGILQTAITTAIAAKQVNEVSIYFRNQQNGHWVGINENAEYDPASLLKVPILMAYYHKAESDPVVLTQKFVYDATTASDMEANQTRHPLVDGQTYTVGELIENMIVYSDNKATDVLLAHIDRKDLDQLFIDLGITSPSQLAPGSPYTISTKNYSLFFRLLRNSTFLHPELSEQALQLLTRTTFNQALVGGVPSDVPVAHKFGLHAVTDPTGNVASIELHDCGIVYKPDSNYLLYVMTKGTDLPSLKEFIKDISQIVYGERWSS